MTITTPIGSYFHWGGTFFPAAPNDEKAALVQRRDAAPLRLGYSAATSSDWKELAHLPGSSAIQDHSVWATTNLRVSWCID